MPYTVKANRQGKHCIHKADADGNPSGAALYCHDTPDGAWAQIKAMTEAEKAAPDSAFVSFDLANHPAVLAIQEQVQEIIDKADYQDPATFHITALYLNTISDDDLNTIIVDSQAAGLKPFMAIAARLDMFENNDERALHIVIEPQGLIAHIQADVHRRFVDAGLEGELSPFSDPAQYKPHITLAYLPPDVPMPELAFNLEIEVSRLLFSRGDNQVIGAVPKDSAMETDKNKMIWRPTQRETNYTPLSGNPLQLCSGCRWFAGANDGGPYCHLIEPWPQDIIATGHCDRWEGPPEEDITQNPLPVVIIEEDEITQALEDPDVQKTLLEAIKKARDAGPDDPADDDKTSVKTDDTQPVKTVADGDDRPQNEDDEPVSDTDKTPDKTAVINDPKPQTQTSKAHTHHTHVEPEKTEGYIAPASNAPSILKSIVNRFTGGIKPGTSVLKAADGHRMMFIVTSNSYQDRLTQWVTSEALAEDVNRHWAGDDTAYLGGIQHLFWHWKELGPVGEIVYSDTWGPFLVELSREIDDPISYAFYSFVENHPEIDWGASQHFLAYKSQDVPNGTFTRILRDEATTLPREDAANLLTFTGVIPMASKRQEYLNKIMKEAYGIEGAAELLEKGLDTLKAEIAKTGGVHKSQDTQPQPADFAPLVLQLTSDLADIVQEFGEIKTSVAGVTDKTKALEETQFTDLTKTVGDLAEQVKGIADELKLKPKSAREAGGADSSDTLTAEQVKALREQTPADGADKDPFFADMDVPAQTN